MLTARYACCLVLLVFLANHAAAQTSLTDWNVVKALTPGTPVRITADSQTLRANTDHITEDALMVSSGHGPQTFDRQRVTLVSTMRPSHRKRNVLIGLAVGAGVGLGIGLALRPGPRQLAPVSSGAVVGGSTVALTLAGGIVGFVIPTGGWREIYKK